MTKANVIVGDCVDIMRSLQQQSYQTIVTSPPYWNLRDYQIPGRWWGDGEHCVLGNEKTVAGYVRHCVEVFRECRRVLRKDGTLWLNIGDTYANQQQCNVPFLVAEALKTDGWFLRSTSIWAKQNPMPESVHGWRVNVADRNRRIKRGSWRPTNAHEFVFLFARSKKYFCDGDSCLERSVDGETRNMRSVWSMPSEPVSGAHFAVFPTELAARCIRSSVSMGGCCRSCRAPYVPLVESNRVPTRPGNNTKVAGRSGKVIGNRDPKRHVTTVRVVDYVPQCVCNAGVDACRVLDPFGGCGTTGVAALSLGCHCDLIEVSPEFSLLASGRISVAESEFAKPLFEGGAP